MQRFLKRDLVDGGIILNREVEIGRVPGAGAGTRTDIKVDAIRQSENSGSFNVITAVIETKGCWNDELLTAMKSQLVDDYLVRLAAPVGIYLVGGSTRRNGIPKIIAADEHRIGPRVRPNHALTKKRRDYRQLSSFGRLSWIAMRPDPFTTPLFPQLHAQALWVPTSLKTLLP